MHILVNLIQHTGNLLIYYLIPLCIVLGIMIFFHEGGHFLVAKLFKVKVLQFALGFGPKIAARVVGETEYSVRYIPLGGFCKMFGEDETEVDSAEISEDDKKRAFYNQHPFKRIAIVAAGPIFNFILALLLLLGLYMISGNYIPAPEIGKVSKNSPAEKAGLEKGDIIVSVQHMKIESWEDITKIIQDRGVKPVLITVNRAGRLISFSITPEMTTEKDIFGEDIKRPLIGIVNSGKVNHVELNPVQAFQESLSQTWSWISLTALFVVKLCQGAVSLKNSVGGPIMIGQMTGQIVKNNVALIIPFMAMISVELGLFNLFPIPVLDGGHIMFSIIEIIRGKPLSPGTRELAIKIGFSLLILLVIIISYNDIMRVINGT